MPYDYKLADRIRACTGELPETFTEKKMFGGITFLYQGLMTVGVVKDDLMVRVVNEKMETVLLSPYVRPMDFTGRILNEYIYVRPGGFDSNEELMKWVLTGLEHAKQKL